MQDSLLSRFDLIFVVLDEMDPDHDRRWADTLVDKCASVYLGAIAVTCKKSAIMENTPKLLCQYYSLPCD